MVKEEFYGSFKSPITSKMLTEDSVKFLDIFVDGNDFYISELRLQEKGRSTILKFNGTFFDEVLDKRFSARTKVHEYGGLSFVVSETEIYFSNFEDQRIYKKNKKGKYLAITDVSTDRYANFIIDKKRDLIFAVQEEHLENEVNNSIVKINKDHKVVKIAAGFDFYSSLAISKDGKKLAFLAWNNPNMPWDAAELWLADIEDNGDLKNLKLIAGSKDESIFLPRFSEDGVLYFVSDKTNFWNLYRYRNEKIESIYPMKAEFGLPLWLFGMSTYDFCYEGEKLYIVCIYNKDGKDNLAILDVENKDLIDITTRFSSISNLAVQGSFALFIGAGVREPTSIVRLDLKTKDFKILKRSKQIHIDSGYISVPKNIEFPTENNKTAFMIYYLPKNKNFIPKKDDKPPLIVKSHVGPTAQSKSILNLEIQYWTSRGFAFADVNYSGSSGYGREYRQRLYGNWGILDVDDCVNAALYLVKKNLVDENKLIIRGSSAGGYTTLAALTFRNIFKAGASYYGISDLEIFHEDTHKFESKYNEKLLGLYPEQRQIYFERSPINFVDKLSCPIILFHGEKDKIVPPDQARKMFDALKRKKLPTAFVLFEKEGHGFKNAENIKKALDCELYFYSKIFNFKLPDKIEPIVIQNLK